MDWALFSNLLVLLVIAQARSSFHKQIMETAEDGGENEADPAETGQVIIKTMKLF